MATRKNTFLLKRSNVPGKVPLPGDLRLGELALNTADVILYTSGTTKNQIIPIGWDRIHRTGDTVTGDFVFYGDISISGSSLPNGYALSVTGDTNITNNLYVGNAITATTIGTSGNCIDDIYVSNIHSCSPLNINPLDEGNVYFGSTSGVTFDLTNKKVGIGTSTPSTLLHVVGSYTGGTDALIPQMLFQNSNTIPNTNKTAIIRTTVGTGYVAGYPEIWLESQQTSTGVGLTKLRTVSNHPLLFYTNDIERARFGETGNFGINTPSPVGKLHVRTGVNKNIIFTSGSTRNLIRSLIDGNSNYVGLEIDTLDLNIKTNGVDRMIINSFGDTGIGTTTPNAKLHINNTTSGNTFLAEDSTNPDSSPFVIDTNGNTGIGTTTPLAKLDVSSNGGRLRLTQNTAGNVFNGIDFVSYVGGVNSSLISNQFTGELRLFTGPTYFPTFYSSGNEIMRISTSGNVGIGVNLPSAKLHVNNTTVGDSFLVEDSTNADSTPFVIDTNGNTGIGTLFPTAKLDVRGNTIISSGLTATTINVPPLADDKIVYTTNNGRLTTTSNFTYNQSNNTFSVNNINVNGNVNITGNTIQSGNTNQIGNITLNGNVTQVGDYYITGNTNQIGNVTMSGNTFITGNTNQIGIFYLSGNTGCTLDVYGNVCIDGDINITGSTTQIGDVFLSGNTNQLGYFYIVSATTGCTFAVTGNTCLNGDLDIVGDTFMLGDFCMNNMNSGGLPTGTNCLDTTLIPTGTTVTHQFQGESGILAHIGDLASGEPNSRGYTYFENNPTLTSFVAVGVGNYTPVIGAPQTFAPYNNLFTVTTGATSATIHKLTYNLPTATGATTATYLKFTVSMSILNANNQALTFQVRRKRGVVFSFIPIGMSINPNSGLAISLTFNGISDAQYLDEFQVVVKNDTGANPANSIRITDMSFSMFT